MCENILLIIKGFIIGIGKIIPGVSGAVFAMILKVYEPMVNAIVNLKKDFYNNIRFLSLIGIGIVTAIIVGSKAILFLLNNYYLYTISFLIGVMINSFFDMVNETLNSCKKEKIIGFTIAIVFFVLSLARIEVINFGQGKMVIMFLSGMVDSFSSIVPGISGTALLMLMGTYNQIITLFAKIINVSTFYANILLLTPFFCGFILGMILTSILINYAFKKYKGIVNNCILGFVVTSIIMLILKLNLFNYSLSDIIISIIFVIIGFEITKRVNI